MNQDRIEDSDGVGATESIINKSFRTKERLIELSPVFSQNALRDISLGLGLEDLSEDPRFKDLKDRVANAVELNAVLAQRFSEKATAEWIGILEPAGVLCGEINTFAEAFSDPQVEANQMAVEMPCEGPGTLRSLGTPLRFSGTPGGHLNPPPALGEHTLEVLREAGFTTEEIRDLIDAGAVASPEGVE